MMRFQVELKRIVSVVGILLILLSISDYYSSAQSSKEITYKEPVTVEWIAELPLSIILDYFSEISKMEIVFDKDINKAAREQGLSMRLLSIPFDEALAAVLRAAGLSYQIRGDTIYIVTQDKQPLPKFKPVEGIKTRLQQPTGRSFNYVSLNEALDYFSRTLGVTILFDKKASETINKLEKSIEVNVQLPDTSMDQVLKKILDDLGLIYQVEGHIIWIVPKRK